MKKRIVLAGIIIAVSLGGLMISNSLAANITPGGSGDPLVSKSYVDEKYNQIINMLNASNINTGGVTSQPTAGTGQAGDGSGGNMWQIIEQIEKIYGLTPGDANKGSVYESVFAFAGQFVIAHEGAEIILRSGSASAYCPGENGLVNLTAGSELFNGMELTANNLVIVPRADGRGVWASTDAWFLVRGGYDIMN